MNDILQWISDHPYEASAIFLAIYEPLSRYIPTEGNWSFFHNLARLADWIQKNRSSEENAVIKTTSEVVIQESKEIL